MAFRSLDFRTAAFERIDDGSIDMAVNGATVSRTFRVVPSAQEAWAGASIYITMMDSTGWRAIGFGGQTGILSNGLILRKQQLSPASTIWSWILKSNMDLFGQLERKSNVDFSDNRTITVFTLEPPCDIGFHLDEDNALEFIVQDDLTFLGRLRATLIYGVM